MMVAIQASEARLERVALGMAALLRFVVEVTDREVLARLGPRGMVVITLPPIALAQALLAKSSLPLGGLLPLVWCSLCYFMLRFRLAVAIEAAVAGAVLACLAAPPGTSWWTGVVLFAAAVGCGILRRWLYAEFWPAYAFACALFALAVPVVLFVAGVPHAGTTFKAFISTLVLAPAVGVLAYALLEAVRRRLGIEMEFPEETEPTYDPAYLYRPFVARSAGL